MTSDRERLARSLRLAEGSLRRAAQAAAGFPVEKQDGKRWRGALSRVRNAQAVVDRQKALLAEKDSGPDELGG